MAWGSRAIVGAAVAASVGLAGCAIDSDLSVDDPDALVDGSRLLVPPDGGIHLAGFGLDGRLDEIEASVVDGRVVVRQPAAHCDGYDVDVALEEVDGSVAIVVATTERGRCDDIGERLVIELTLRSPAAVDAVTVEGTYERG
ncbi:MAG: hypothetical protein AAF480_08610 [Actinomycetota bacterium]